MLRTTRRTTRFLYALRGSGLPRIAERIRKLVAQIVGKKGCESEVWIDDFCGELRFRCDLSEHMGSQIYFRGTYSTGQLVLLKRLLSPDSIFVDIGANQGEFTICAAALVPNGAVHAFEPVSALRERLQINIEANDFQNIEIHPFGLSDHSQENVPIFGSSATFSDGTEHSGLPTLYRLEHRQHELELVNLRPLDACLPPTLTRVDIIKIDVEGAEIFVLDGAVKVVSSSRPYIIFEANEETSRAAGYNVKLIFDWFRARNYRLEIIGFDGRLLKLDEHQSFCNILATPQEKPLPDLAS